MALVREIGCLGVVVDKERGACTVLGSAHSVDDWLWGWEHGIRGDHVDFEITEVLDLEASVAVLAGLRIGDRLELRDRLSAVPAVWLRIPLWMELPRMRAIADWPFRWVAHPRTE